MCSINNKNNNTYRFNDPSWQTKIKLVVTQYRVCNKQASVYTH